MMKKRKKYLKPNIVTSKIKINFFLRNMTIWNNFDIVGDVYAQSGATDGGNTDSGDTIDGMGDGGGV